MQGENFLLYLFQLLAVLMIFLNYDFFRRYACIFLLCMVVCRKFARARNSFPQGLRLGGYCIESLFKTKEDRYFLEELRHRRHERHGTGSVRVPLDRNHHQDPGTAGGQPRRRHQLA